MGLVAKRNLTHLYPVAVIFLASATAEAYHYLRQHHHDVFNRLIFPTGIAGLAICLFAIWQTIAGITNMLISERIYSQHFAAIAGFINKTVPKSSRIFHTNWSDSQYLIGLAPDYEYIVTLDPIYMFTYNQNLYNLYRNVSFGQSQNPYDILKETFGVRWGYAGKNYFNAFIEQVRHDSRFSIEGEDQLGIVFSLK